MLKLNFWLLCTAIVLFCVYVEHSRVFCLPKGEEENTDRVEHVHSDDDDASSEFDESDESNELNGENVDKERLIFSFLNKNKGQKNISAIFGQKNITNLLPSITFPFPIKQNKTVLTCQCGKSNNNNKIVGGEISRDHAWPWMAAIAYTGDGTQSPQVLCGGSIINDRYILTAAHCAPAITETGLDQYKIYIGDNKIQNASATQRILDIQSVKSHPSYDESNMDYDAALIKLSTPLTFNSVISPVCLGQAGNPFTGRQSVVAGWGSTFFGGQAVNNLMETRVNVLTNAQCKQAYAQPPTTITNNMMCATAQGKDSCQGDSGGPLFVNRTVSSNIYKQIGIVSFGVDCADGTHPGVYTRVQKVISWIKANTKDAKYCNTSFQN